MKLCFSTYGQVLRRCVAKGVTQVALGRALLSVLDGSDGSYYSDSDVSDLFNGKKDVSPAVMETARKTEMREMASRFKEGVAPSIDENLIGELTASLIALIESDRSIKGTTPVDLVRGTTKASLLKDGVPDRNGFLAGLYLYVALRAKNVGSQEDAHVIRTKGLPSRRKDDLVGFDGGEDVGLASGLQLLRCGRFSVRLIAGDLFAFTEDGGHEDGETEGIVVIPVETTFRARLSSPIDSFDENFISENTIHGTFLKRWEESAGSLEELSTLIWDNLRKQYGSNGIADGHMPIGAVAAVPGKRCIYFLLAISELDEDGIAHCEARDIDDAISALLVFHDRYGQGNPMYMPLMGTGRSRANLTLQGSFEKIVGLMENNRKIIHGDISIVVLPKEISEIDVERA